MNVNEWLEEIETAKKREKDYRKKGKDILDIYSNEKDSPFNILYSNTETLLPALFSQVPFPVVQRRYKDDDPLGKSVSEASQRILEYLVDTDLEDYDNFECSISNATLDGLLPGRGVTSVQYESEDEWETVVTNSRKWDRVYFGFAHKWSSMPWVAFYEELDKEEAKRLFEDNVKHLKFVENENDDEDEEENKDLGHRKTTPIYQIWDKSDRTVKYISPQYKDGFLREDEDPLGIPGFFNIPKPLQFVIKSNDLTPTPPYALYENQAAELNKIQSRLNSVVEAIKARGVYNGLLGEEIENILKEDDNALIPTDKASSLLEGDLGKNIWFLPLGELIAVAQQLIQARESAKQVIYEITGISDIVRGQSMASETLGAQKIKEAWGTMRLKRLQKEVQRYALDTMKIMLSIAVQNFSEKSWAKMTGLPFSTTEQKEQAERIVQAAQMGGVMEGNKDVMASMQILQMPYWGDILKVLKDNFSRSYRVDIETNSTLDVEATEDKQLIGDFMNAFAQFTNGISPMVEKGAIPFEAAKAMMLAVTKRYRFGREVEDELKKMQPPKPQQNPEMDKAVKQFQQEKQKFEQEQKRVGEQFDTEFQKLEAEKLQLAYDKKLAKMEVQFQEKLAAAKQQLGEVEAQNALKDIVANHKRDVQSMLDKHKQNIEMSIMKSEPKEKEGTTIINQMPSENKSIRVERENGIITGASVSVD